MLDNDFKEPDIDRYLEAFNEFDPSVAVLGDAYTAGEAQEYQQLIDDLEQEHPHKNYIVVPKCNSAFEFLDDDTILGYPIGYSELEPEDFSQLEDWRGRQVHILGSSPTKTWSAIQRLTQPTLTGLEPADIKGLDYNGFSKASYFGEYWSRDGYQEADLLTIRETVRRSLEEAKKFWQEKGVWPETTPVELYGEPVLEPEEPIIMDEGGDPITSKEQLENLYVRTYEEKGNIAFQSQSQADFIEYREGYTPL